MGPGDIEAGWGLGNSPGSSPLLLCAKLRKTKTTPTNQTQPLLQLYLDGSLKHSLARPGTAQMEALYGAPDSQH